MCDFTFLVLKLVHIFPQQELMKVLYVRFKIVKIIDFEFNLSLKTSDKFRPAKQRKIIVQSAKILSKESDKETLRLKQDWTQPAQINICKVEKHWKSD